MNTIRLGLFQESSDRFAFAVHADAVPDRLYREFDSRDLRTAIVSGPDGNASIRFVTMPDEVEQARNLFFEASSRDSGSSINGGVMALDSFSDSWNLTVLRDTAPGYHVALAFSFYPLRVSFGEGNLVHVGYEVVTPPDAGSAWYMLHPALAAQAAAIFFPNAPTLADACALLANRPGVLDYLRGMGDTFSLSDIEHLARSHQVTPSTVLAAAKGADGEDQSWLYRVKLSQRAMAEAELLAVSFARAKARHLAGLRSRPPRHGLREEQLQFREVEIGSFAHRLALLELCHSYGIGLWSCPMSLSNDDFLDSDEDQPSDHWSVAVNPE